MENTQKIQLLFIALIIISVMVKRVESDPAQDLYYDNSLIEDGETYFSNIRQLTFSGENAEAYFSADGNSLIFQSHDGDTLCDQIYIMNIFSGDTKLVSTGNGVTTCSYFQYPNCEKIIYASTHLGDKRCPKKPDYSRGYVWKLYPDYDIFRSNIDGTSLEQLTTDPNYDAEATVAFDGSKIIYTSMASGDLDIWTMNVNGTEKKQLTTRLGYDGGAFLMHSPTKLYGGYITRQHLKRLLITNHYLLVILFAQWRYKFGRWTLTDPIKNRLRATAQQILDLIFFLVATRLFFHLTCMTLKDEILIYMQLTLMEQI